MHAEDLPLDERRERQPIKQRVDALPHPDAVLVAEALEALEAEAEERVDVGGLVVAADEVDGARVLDLEREQQADAVVLSL